MYYTSTASSRFYKNKKIIIERKWMETIPVANQLVYLL